MIEIKSIRLPIGHDDGELTRAVANRLGVNGSEVQRVIVRKRSVDARKHRSDGVKFEYLLWVEVRNQEAVLENCRKDEQLGVAVDERYRYADVTPGTARTECRPIVVGAGPCGIFSALLLARAGRRPIVLERGKMAGPRARDVTRFWREGGEVDTDSNVQFGEGGAGAFSDGKLYTQIRDREHRVRFLLEEFARHGAPEDILVKGRPHIGTDRLIKVVRNLREEIESLGGEYRFGTKVVDLVIDRGRLVGLQLEDGSEIETKEVVFAIGHSARDTFEMLAEKGVPLEAKNFSVGVRIEHPQKLIDRAFYGKHAGHASLGSAPYKFAERAAGMRTAYSFCMCPGGLVVASSSEVGGVVTNGMSSYARDEANANAGFMVEVGPADFGASDPLAGIRFQREIEGRAFAVAGENYRAPAQLLGDFLKKRASRGPGAVEPSYRPGVVFGDLRDCLPDFVLESLRAATMRIARKIPGFELSDAVLTAPETRSSSPLRIARDPETCECTSLQGFFPAGEGAGYAGGIVSAAVDGLRVAEALLTRHTAKASKISVAEEFQ